MHIKAQPPVLIPTNFVREIEQLSKAALMDMTFDYATRCAGSEEPALVMAEFRKTRDIILRYRSAPK